MEISFVRHGKSKHTDYCKVACNELNDWLQKYDEEGVFEETFYPLGTLKKVSRASVVVTSDLKRSIDSAKILNPNIKLMSSALFRETELPVPSNNLWSLKLKPSLWTVILRCLWFTGYSTGCESLSSAKQRANTQLLA